MPIKSISISIFFFFPLKNYKKDNKIGQFIISSILDMLPRVGPMRGFKIKNWKQIVYKKQNKMFPLDEKIKHGDVIWQWNFFWGIIWQLEGEV